jgi:diaminohydroxyphosphoribosylaminopyrimidine deaminase/5-amino-6-(5-phosphoribosylamino)uracil reductase
MRRALDLAARGWGRVHPNPMVGAVVVRDGAVVGEGWHAEYGGPHAEVVALERAGADAAGADLYVSLEPCAHHGRTPPCTDAILAAGIRRVFYAAADPHRTAAGGAERLRQHAIEAVAGPLTGEARVLNAPFFHVHERGRPWLALKLALSLDGAIARAPGERTDISGPRARAEAQRLRAGFDAILVGSGTARVDDPQLTARGAVEPRVSPTRIVLDSEASLSPASVLARTAGDVPTWVVAAHCRDEQRVEALRAAGVQVHIVPADEHGVSLDGLLRMLHTRAIHTVLCEGGARLATRLIAEDRVDRTYLFLSPVFLGPGSVPAFTLDAPAEPGWQLRETRALGNDALVVWDRVRVQV